LMEKRVAEDDSEYTHAQFVEHYGDEAQWWWDQAESAADVSPDQLRDYFQLLFNTADANSDGVLSVIEFARLLSLCKFDFPDEAIIQLLQTVDVDQDGVINFDEMSACMIALLEARAEESAATVIVSPMWNQVPADMLEEHLETLFHEGDQNGDGVLQPPEFLSLLEEAGLNFPAKLVLRLFMEADTNEDGVIEYEEYMPAMLQVMQAMRDEPLDSDLERVRCEKAAGNW